MSGICCLLLTHNRVFIFGSSQRLTAMGDRNVLQYFFSFDPYLDQFAIAPAPGPGAYGFNSAGIVAVHWAQVPNRTNNPNAGTFAHIHPVELGGATIAVTTQFTGCSLCFRLSGGILYAAHINPGGTSVPPPIGGGNLLARQ